MGLGRWGGGEGVAELAQSRGRRGALVRGSAGGLLGAAPAGGGRRGADHLAEGAERKGPMGRWGRQRQNSANENAMKCEISWQLGTN